MRILIDMDPIVYRAGFAAQNDWKIITWSEVLDPDDPESDIMHEHACLYMREREGQHNNVEQMVEELGLHPDEYEVVPWVDPLPVSYALQIVRTELENILKACEGFLAETGTETSSYEGYLSSSTNFRKNIATLKEYKGSRKDRERPYHYHTIREYMVANWSAQIIVGMEADDALAIEQWADDPYEPTTVIATIDKDLNNIPGLKYNYGKKESYYITEQEALVHFYRQVLTGDSADDIPGLYRVGAKTAEKLITKDMTEDQMYAVCLEEYTKRINAAYEKGTPEKFEGYYNFKMSPLEHLVENARLLWMLQYEDQLWTPPGEAGGSIETAGFADYGEEEEF